MILAMHAYFHDGSRGESLKHLRSEGLLDFDRIARAASFDFN
jgi:hypothetical protein